jgi:DNA topoisomerase-3
MLGYTAQQTLDYTQNLYEKKLVTYPRTDSRFLTEDMAHSLPDLVNLAFTHSPLRVWIIYLFMRNRLWITKRSQTIMPLFRPRNCRKCNLSELPKGELAILQLISNRLCVAVGDPHRYAETIIELTVAVQCFSQRQNGCAGWMESSGSEK